MVLRAAVDGGISDVVAQQKSKRIRTHNISLVRYMGEKDGGLRSPREELEAEDVGVRTPAEIRWLGGAKVRARFQEQKGGISSVAAAVLGEAAFGRPCKSEVRLLGGRYEVDAFGEVRPDAFCGRCSAWGNVAPHCRAKYPRCALCARECATVDHQCPVKGRRTGRGRLCPHGTAKCANCGGLHEARADVCTAKREARQVARG